MIISVASGKGGTGKTTIAVNLALVLERAQLLDCDVSAPNAHLFLKPNIYEKKLATIPVPQVDEGKCTFCGKCRDVCAYHAIVVIPATPSRKGSVLLFSHLCHGCGACQLFCPEKAITEIRKEIGGIEIGEAADIQFVHGQLKIGEVMGTALIRQVKAQMDLTRPVIIDAPPGTSCPVIAAVNKSDFCILVTEPTPFGLNDLILAVETVRKLKIPFGIIINRCDIGDDKVESYCQENHIPVLMRIPFDKEIARLYSQGIPLVNENPAYREKFTELAELVRKMAG